MTLLPSRTRSSQASQQMAASRRPDRAVTFAITKSTLSAHSACTDDGVPKGLHLDVVEPQSRRLDRFSDQRTRSTRKTSSPSGATVESRAPPHAPQTWCAAHLRRLASPAEPDGMDQSRGAITVSSNPVAIQIPQQTRNAEGLTCLHSLASFVVLQRCSDFKS
jgi:hypothetical protein